MDKLKAFETFVAVAQKGSLTAAAKAEGVAPAIIGRRLDGLEEHLGVRLMVRTTRPPSGPPSGICPAATAAMSALDTLAATGRSEYTDTCRSRNR